MINFRKNMGNIVSNAKPEATDQEVTEGQAWCAVDLDKGSHLSSAGDDDQDFRGGPTESVGHTALDPFQQPLPVNFRHQPSVSPIPQQSNMLLDHVVEKEIDDMVLLNKKVRFNLRYRS